jgi:two-component system sensor kinase FixL
MFRLAPEATRNQPLYALGDRQLDVPRLRQLLGEVLETKGTLDDFEIQDEFATIGRRALLLNARTLVRGGGRADLILLAIEDVTERKRTEQRLRESEAMTRAGVRTAVDGVMAIDERGIVLSFNPAAEHIFGYTSDEVVGKTVGMLLPATVGDESADDVTRYLAGAHPGVFGIRREVTARRKDGGTFPCDLHVGEYDDGTGRCFVATLRDITERKQTEEHARRQQAEMAHVLRVATIERLAAGLAHELNQPLTAIANDIETCATYVRAGKVGPRRLLGLLDRAGAEALRAGEIVHHLREYVQRGEPRLEPSDLTEIVRNATRWLAREMERERITLRLDLAAHPLPIVADRVQLEQVMVNLLQNAVDAVREAGTERRDIVIHTTQMDGTAEVSVDDTGIGLPAAAAERLYEPFFTTKPEGMGMGLAISRTIVEMHHGQLAVEPRATGSGTTVRLTLPVDRTPRARGGAK